MALPPASLDRSAPVVTHPPRYKRAFDLALLLTAHVLLLPVWIMLWILIVSAIWLDDRGPIFYRQVRLGLDGKRFVCLKFRTMVPDAEKETGPVWADGQDHRITRVGHMLRRTGLDELPQVVNILRGDMSFVGPRAERPELYDKFQREVPGFRERLRLRPGLTGLAQVSGEYNLHPRLKLRYDLEYMASMSLWLDVRLVVSSVRNTLFGRWDMRDDDSPLHASTQLNGNGSFAAGHEELRHVRPEVTAKPEANGRHAGHTLRSTPPMPGTHRNHES